MRKGMSFIEIMFTVLIMATTMLPIFQYFSRTTGMSKQEKAQAAAAAYAAKVMNKYLYELDWTNVVDDPGGQGWLDENTKKGIEFQWSVKVTSVWPVDREFSVKRTKYHNPCGGACTGATEDLPRRAPKDINPVFINKVKTILKNVVLIFKWRGTGDNTWDDTRTMILVGRRGMLEEANQ